MKVIVFDVSPMRMSKYSGFPTRRVTFEVMDEPGTYVYLNMDEKFRVDVERWSPHIAKGTVLDVTLQTGKKNNVSLFGSFSIVRSVKS